MGADWVRVRVDLARDPKVIAIARALSADRGFCAWASADASADGPPPRPVAVRLAVAGLVAVWGVLRTDGHPDGDDLAVDHVRLDDLDEIAGVPGFGSAMASVGWVAARSEGGVRLPKFFQQNGSTDDLRRKRDAERKRRARAELRATPPDASGDESADASADGPVDVRPRGRGRGRGTNPSSEEPAKGPEDAGFARFWAAYPRREKKADAARAFARLAPDPAALDVMLRAVEAQKKPGGPLEARHVDGRSTIPHPTTWLNGRRWEDEEQGGPELPAPTVDHREQNRQRLLQLVRKEAITPAQAENEFGGSLE